MSKITKISASQLSAKGIKRIVNGGKPAHSRKVPLHPHETIWPKEQKKYFYCRKYKALCMFDNTVSAWVATMSIYTQMSIAFCKDEKLKKEAAAAWAKVLRKLKNNRLNVTYTIYKKGIK